MLDWSFMPGIGVLVFHVIIRVWTHTLKRAKFRSAHILIFAKSDNASFRTTASQQQIFIPSIRQGKMKFLKVGRVAIITRGRYAGKKVSTFVFCAGQTRFDCTKAMAGLEIVEEDSNHF